MLIGLVLEISIEVFSEEIIFSKISSVNSVPILNISSLILILLCKNFPIKDLFETYISLRPSFDSFWAIKKFNLSFNLITSKNYDSETWN